MSDDLFYLVGYDEGGSRQTEGAAGTKRLVCNIEGGGKLAIWGREGNTVNIDAVLGAGRPCVVRCMSEETRILGSGEVRPHALGSPGRAFGGLHAHGHGKERPQLGETRFRPLNRGRRPDGRLHPVDQCHRGHLE